MANNTAIDEYQEQLNDLRQEYAEQLPHNIREIETLWEELCQGTWDDEAVRTLHRLAHGLTGSGASFGFAAVSDAARVLEGDLQSIVESGVPPTDAQKTQISAHLAALKEAFESDQISPTDRLNTQLPFELPLTAEQDNRLIFLVEDDVHLAKDLALQVGYFGYTVRTFPQLSELKEAVNQTPPAAIIMDIIFPEGNLAGTEIIAEIQQERETPIPVIFVSARSDLTARLQAVRAGGNAYFTKPVDISSLIDKLDTLTGHEVPEPYRILIVDDNLTLAAHSELILQQAGISTAVVTDPMQIMQPLVDFRPDLILMDMYMPECDGRELASIIRQQETYVSIPIVFLSSETNIDAQLAAMRLGGDDFLTKPIEPEHLIASVTSRVMRARILRTLMVRDSLTGLLNHTATEAQLNIEVARTKRHSTPLAFAMIDIDRFKSVNDTYGHPTGDRVLKSLSRLLQQRLRKTDIIGRYGGEEFAVVLPDTDDSTAAKVLNEIREGFAQVRHQNGEDGFFVTFSCGVASFPQYEDATRLNDAADKALYVAKSGGRNRVVLADK